MPEPSTPTRDQIRDIYDRLAPDWDRREGAGERLMIGEDMRRTLANHLRGDVLELGSGTGATLRHMDWDRGLVTSFTATDISPGMLDQARQRADIQGRPVTFREIDASSLPFPDESFDTVTTSLMLCTVPDPERTLREMSRVTRPGGRIVILEHVRAPNPILAFLQKVLTPMQVRRMGCHLDRPTDQLVRDMGFQVERHDRKFLSIFRLLVFPPLQKSSAPDDTATSS